MAAIAAAMILLISSSCTGRKADNMEPAGETVEVVIAQDDVARDSAVAAGDVESDSVAEQPGIEVL